MLYRQVEFRYEFRDYQKRVLNTLDEKSKDNKLHIVAAPGSGKTVLGLEIIRRNDTPCLVLAPSISIREQWIDRFLSLFVKQEAYDYWKIRISSDVRDPGIITCITYQALFSLYSDEDFESAILNLRKRGYTCICLDESHHLKKEWWKVLEKTVQLLENPLIISLTATPPYDSDNQEWARYNKLCGAIDCEVLTPEMVKKNALCPYQDHVYLTVPTEDEVNEFEEREELMRRNVREILMSETLYRLMRDYDALIVPHERAEIFIEEPRFLNALVSYLYYYGIESAVYYEKEKTKVDNVINHWNSELVAYAYNEKAAELDGELLELFLEVIIKKDAEHFDEELLGEFVSELSKKQFFKENRIYISNRRDEIEKLSRNSISKIDAINSIVSVEAKSTGNNLKMVILLDYIGREDLSKIETNEKLNKLNCVSVFESIRRMEHLNNLDQYMNSYIDYVKELAGTNIGLLCGTFAILPDEAAGYFKKSGKPLGNTGYFLLEIGDSERSEIVSKVTEILEKKIIRILIGTVSLLGEGWDAPGVNTVVIGSTISSFVQTNQMRGRGMRLDKNDKHKTANIWHLVTLNPDLKYGGYIGGDDYKNLIRRFDTILGISRAGDGISSGIERLGLPGESVGKIRFSYSFINQYGRDVLAYASNRKNIEGQWKRLMTFSGDCSITRDMATIRSSGLVRLGKNDENFSYNEIRAIAQGLHKNMCDNGLISGETKVVIKNSFADRRVGVYLDKCRPKEGKLFLKYYEQMTGEVIAPRYLLVKGFGPWKKYIALPDYLKNKAAAIQLAQQVDFMNHKVIYTKNPEGLRLLFELRLSNIKLDRSTIEKVRMVVIR